VVDELLLRLRRRHDLGELRQERLGSVLVAELEIDDDGLGLGDPPADPVREHALVGAEPLVLVEVRLPGVEVANLVLDVHGGGAHDSSSVGCERR